jgi:hypothetical protein
VGVLSGPDGYWVVCVDRASGRVIAELCSDHDQAYRYAVGARSPDVWTTVVAREPCWADRNLVNRC